MDEEKFSPERFLELIGERDESAERSSANRKFAGIEGKMFHVEHPAETDVRDRWTTRGEVGGVSAEVRKALDKAGDSSAKVDRRDVLRSRALKMDKRDNDSIHRNSDRFREAKSRAIPNAREGKSSANRRFAGLLGRTVESVKRTFGWGERKAFVVEPKWVAVEANGDRRLENRRFAGNDAADAEQVGGRARRDVREEMPRAREKVWREAEVESAGRARSRRWTEVGLSEKREAGARRAAADLQKITENSDVFAESRVKIAEFRKSDVSGSVDLRAISRAIERDARRY